MIDSVEKFKKFCRSHLRLSSFLFLFLPCPIFKFYAAFDYIRVKGDGVGALIDMVMRGSTRKRQHSVNTYRRADVFDLMIPKVFVFQPQLVRNLIVCSARDA